MDRRVLGRWGEDEAALYLKKNGYTLLEAGYRSRWGEIDIIARKDGVVAFVEVKLRRDARFASAAENVSASKAEKLRLTAQMWLAENGDALQPRFDVVEIYAPDGINTRRPCINHIIDAFR